ncbi:hypothetical protein DJ533_00375 (plasmid) [Acinetobacter defluvii]|uniref:Uncharacterized protein n=1 Tax=Acinetobacter defluvii TaxID=1871111 RepID=A0A2S2F888_9GAMM|nr:hypothetical protein [Acinetobacter defluvii]AWL27173.1 hypothetical protein DJ533_00375 [Acinetobacter defluvii]
MLAIIQNLLSKFPIIIKNLALFLILTFVAFQTLIMWVDASEIEEQGRLDANEKYINLMK